MQKASYLRCKNIQLGYTLPTHITEKAGISNCRIYLSCDNLFTITGLSSVYDPEVFGSYDGYGTSGKTYPLQRTIFCWCKFEFLNLLTEDYYEIKYKKRRRLPFVGRDIVDGYILQRFA